LAVFAGGPPPDQYGIYGDVKPYLAPDDTRAVVEHNNGVSVWELPASTPGAVMLHKAGIRNVQGVSRDSRRVLSLEAGKVVVWDTTNGQTLMAFPEDGALCAAFAPDGDHVAVAGYKGEAKIRKLSAVTS